jgi:hypothetical protein
LEEQLRHNTIPFLDSQLYLFNTQTEPKVTGFSEPVCGPPQTGAYVSSQALHLGRADFSFAGDATTVATRTKKL